MKAIAHKRNVGWPLPFERRKIVDEVMYVCVVLNAVDEHPSYYVLPPEEVRARGKWYPNSKRAILDVTSLKGGEFYNAWHLIEIALARVGIQTGANT